MTRAKKILVALSVVMAGAAAAWLVLPRTLGAAEPRVDGTGPQSAETPLVVPGVIEAASDPVSLSFEQSGRVVEVLVDEGDHVVSGQVVARLDDRLARARVRQAEAALASARARRDLSVRGARAEEIRALEAEVRAADAMARERTRTAERARMLLGAGAGTAADRDGAEDAAAVAGANREGADARLALLRRGTRTESRREAAAAVAAAEAALEEANVSLDQTVLRAPRDGIVLRRYVEPGEHVAQMPPSVVVTMADLTQLRVRAEVDEADVGRVFAGQRGYATADAFGARRFSGRIVHITAELGRKVLRAEEPRARADTKVLEVLLALDHPEQLPLGLRVDVRLQRR